MLNQGFLLVEILIAIALIAIITFVGFQLVMVSQQGGKVVADRDTANRLAEEAIEILRNLAVEDWGKFQAWTKSTEGGSSVDSDLFLELNPETGVWSIIDVIGGDLELTQYEVVTIDDRNYERFFRLYDVSRDTDGDIDPTYDPENRDFSTQKVKVFVRLLGQTDDLVVLTEYLTRWRNLVCAQDDWSVGPSGDTQGCDISPTKYSSLEDVEYDAGTGALRLEY